MGVSYSRAATAVQRIKECSSMQAPATVTIILVPYCCMFFMCRNIVGKVLNLNPEILSYRALCYLPTIAMRSITPQEVAGNCGGISYCCCCSVAFVAPNARGRQLTTLRAGARTLSGQGWLACTRVPAAIIPSWVLPQANSGQQTQQEQLLQSSLILFQVRVAPVRHQGCQLYATHHHRRLILNYCSYCSNDELHREKGERHLWALAGRLHEGQCRRFPPAG